MALPFPRPSARPGAEATVIASYVRGGGQERLPASLAHFTDGAQALTVRTNQEEIVRPYAALPRAIAGLARWYQVLGDVVVLIAVHVIGHQGAAGRSPSLSNSPLDPFAAPVARMRAGANLGKQGKSRLHRIARRIREWMLGLENHASSLGVLEPRSPARLRLGMPPTPSPLIRVVPTLAAAADAVPKTHEIPSSVRMSGGAMAFRHAQTITY